jgi:AP-4 complex subunit sigma-1
MPIKFIVVANKSQQIRLRKFYDQALLNSSSDALITEVIFKVISRHSKQASFFHYERTKIIYRQFAGLYFIVGATIDENELALYEIVQFFVQCLDIYFNGVTELDLLFSVDAIYMLLDEIFLDGDIIETNKERVVEGIVLLEQASTDYEARKANGQTTVSSSGGGLFSSANATIMQHHIRWRTQLPQQPLLEKF